MTIPSSHAGTRFERYDGRCSLQSLSGTAVWPESWTSRAIEGQS